MAGVLLNWDIVYRADKNVLEVMLLARDPSAHLEDGRTSDEECCRRQNSEYRWCRSIRLYF